MHILVINLVSSCVQWGTASAIQCSNFHALLNVSSMSSFSTHCCLCNILVAFLQSLYAHSNVDYRYCNQYVDKDALIYLILANEMLHELHPDIITIAEDVSCCCTSCPFHVIFCSCEIVSGFRHAIWYGHIPHPLQNVRPHTSHELSLINNLTYKVWVMWYKNEKSHDWAGIEKHFLMICHFCVTWPTF